MEGDDENKSESTDQWRVLELFSGIGGMHEALKISGVSSKVIVAVDINEMANKVYKLNYEDTIIWNRNIQSITAKELEDLRIDTILMSPPCQPFTRQGKQLGIDDPRSEGFLGICSNLINSLVGLERVLMENVKGFEESEAQKMFLEVLKNAGFYFQEFLLNPIECLGIPNSRTRYFCIARKSRDFSFKSERYLDKIPGLNNIKEIPLNEFLEEGNTDSFLIDKKNLLKNCWVYDIVHPSSVSTNCFTKAYGHFARGTGSVFSHKDKEFMDEVFNRIRQEDLPENKKIAELNKLELRYFTPREIEKLMGFETSLKYPDFTTNRQKYKLLGNSLNVKIVSELIKLLC